MIMSGKTDPKRIGEHTEKMAGRYLFDTSDQTESQSMDMRTKIRSEAMFNAITFYGVLAEGMKSKRAREIKDLIERLLIATSPEGGRHEAVEVLRQNFPRKVTIAKGREEYTVEE